MYRRCPILKQHKNSLISVLIITAVIIAAYYGGYITFDRYVSKQLGLFDSLETGQDKAPLGFGYIQPEVVDGFTEDPIAEAEVVIPELNQRFFTGQDGLTAPIKVPIFEDEHFSNIKPKPWGEVTIIVYKEGYIEYVLLHAHVWENQSRKGPRIMLFPDTEGNSEPFAIIEGPHRVWVKELVEKYRD